MKLKKQKCWLFVVMAVLILGVAGCAIKPVAKVSPGTNISYAWLGFPQPCPTPQDAKILIEKTSPKIVKPGQEAQITISLVNKEEYPIDILTIEEKIPTDLEIKKITPKPASTIQGTYTWNFKNIQPGQQEVITITGKVNKTGSMRYLSKTILNFEIPEKTERESVVAVVAPGLGMQVEAPEMAVINEKVPIVFSVRNTGTAMVKDAKITHTLPPGILTYIGRSKIECDIGDIRPDQTKKFGYYIKGVKKGRYNTRFSAVAQGGLSASDSMSLKITAPELSIALDAPRKRFVGNFISYRTTIKNTGDSTSTNLAVTLDLPDGVSLSSVNENGRTLKNQVTWDVAQLYPGDSKTFIAKVVAQKISTARAVASVTANGITNESAVTTDIAGISALLCKLMDKNDPVPLNDTEVYEVIATNQGSLPATMVKLTCYLESAMEYVKSSGATKGSLSGNILTFEPLPLLEPQADAKWHITVKAIKAGDVRFKAEVISDQLSRPVVLVEPTRFY